MISANLRIRENNIDDKLPFDVADGTAVTDLLVSGSITNQGGAATRGLAKSGDGTMLLSGINSYPGPTDVLAGCLILNDFLAIPDLTMVTVADGAGFGGIVGASNLIDLDIADIIANVSEEVDVPIAACNEAIEARCYKY